MKRIILATLTLSYALSSCLDASDDEDIDLQSPTISGVGSSQTVAPDHFIEISEDATTIPLAFQVEDETGISEIVIDSHNGFDGHTHGRSANTGFVLLNHNHTITQADLEDPRRFQSELDDELVIHLDETNPLIPSGALVLAGPYHFSIKAGDLEGNETSYADNTTYHTTFYLQREYAPRMEVNDINTTTGTLSGSVWRNMDHASSSDIIFLWIYISRPDLSNPAQEGEVLAEWIWGTSNWPHQFRDNAGDELVNGQVIDLSELLTGEEDIQQMTESEIITLWAEDANGNISVKSF